METVERFPPLESYPTALGRRFCYSGAVVGGERVVVHVHHRLRDRARGPGLRMHIDGGRVNNRSMDLVFCEIFYSSFFILIFYSVQKTDPEFYLRFTFFKKYLQFLQ